MSKREPLSRELEQLLQAERDVPVAPPGAAERVLARVRASVAAPAAPAVAAAATTPWLKLVLALVVTGGAATAWLATRSEATEVAAPGAAEAAHVTETPAPLTKGAAHVAAVPSELTNGAARIAQVPATFTNEAARVAAVPAPFTNEAARIAQVPALFTNEAARVAAVPAPETNPAARVAEAAAPALRAAAPATKGTAAEPVKPAPRDPEAERKLLDKAQAALSAGDVAGALDATKQHAARWPRGALTEERLSLRVRALVRAGRTPEAQARADELRRRYPQSIHLPAVEAVLSVTPR